jgi:hypothetical protein
VAIAALAATFWLLVATVRLVRDEATQVTREPPVPPIAQVAPPAPAGNPLSKAAVVAGFNAIRPQIAGCFPTYQVPGMAMVNVTIAKSGRVSQADVTGKFAGTPTGACVERAVRTAQFPPSDGLMTPYPFQLR